MTSVVAARIAEAAPPQRKVAIVGAGSVGATIAYACLIRGVGKTIALYDIDADKVRAQVLDLNQGHPVRAGGERGGADDVAVTADADIVVITAGAKQKPGQTRLELAASTSRCVGRCCLCSSRCLRTRSSSW